MNFNEEPKAKLDGVEIPIQCIAEQYVKSNSFSTAHYHDYVEILYGTHGVAEVWMEGRLFTLSVGKMLVINSRTPHTVRAVSSSYCDYIVIKFMPQVLYGAQQSVFEFKYIVPFMLANSIYDNYFDKSLLADTEIPRIMQEIVREWNSKEYGFEIALRIYVLKISLWLIRHWHSRRCGTALRSELQLFSRIFKKYMKNSFNQYLNYIRITEAKRMLMCSDMDITKIAMETGFATTSYFIERFKKECGTTPKHFHGKFNDN